MIVNRYIFWLAVISVGCMIAERIAPWRKQKLFRRQILQDFFWLVFNGYFFGLLFGTFLRWVYQVEGGLFIKLSGSPLKTINLLKSQSFFLQLLIYLVVADLLEWVIHNLLHRVNWLWRFHRFHHSIHDMDWIGNFRFHWMEIIVYNLIKYIPLTLMGAPRQVVLVVAIISTTIGHLNHSNLFISWGPLRYIFNSPRMHIWHHDVEMHKKSGQNFAVVFSLWDWLFNTAYMPLKKSPERIGFKNDDRFPNSLLWRFFIPFINKPR